MVKQATHTSAERTRTKSNLEQFFDEWSAITTPNPIHSKERFVCGAAVTLLRMSDYVYLGSIRTLGSGNRRKGYGSLLLRLICELADKYQVTIELCVGPFGDRPRMGKYQLRAWYKRYGFKFCRRSNRDDMRREPQEVNKNVGLSQ